MKKKSKYPQKRMQIRADKWEWIFFVGIIVIVFLPLLNFPPLFSPPDFGKAIIFRIIVSILFFLFIVKSLFSKSAEKYADSNAEKTLNYYQRKSAETASSKDRMGANLPAVPISVNQQKAKRLILISLATLFFVFLLATIFSQDWHHSLFDTPYRSGGSLNFFFYIVFSFLAFWTIKDNKKWQKILITTLIVGILICLIGIEQKFNFTGSNFIVKMSEPASTLGGAIFFGNYLLLLIFISLALGIREKNLKKRIFYILVFSIFLFTIIFCAQKRGPLAGLSMGIFYFIFFFPFALSKKWAGLSLKSWIRSAVIILMIFMIFGLSFLKIHPEIVAPFKNETLRTLFSRLSAMYPTTESLGSRYSSWIVSFESFKEKPIFGWGPENFSVAFDKNYDPSLPGIEIDPRGWWGTHASWWDKPHNILIEYAISAGILGLLAFLMLLGVLFWQLQRVKSAEIYADSNADKTLNNYQRKSAVAASSEDGISANLPDAQISVNQRKNCRENVLIAHALQTTFLAYLVALIFSFDTPSAYIIFFLLIGFSLYLTSSVNAEITPISTLNNAKKISANQRCYQRKISGIKKWRWPIILVFFGILIGFIYSLNIKPLQINKNINVAIAASGAKNCQGAINIMENLLKKRSFLDDYLRLKYITILDDCIEQEPTKSMDFVKMAWETAKENTKIRPTYIRNWIFLGGYTNMLIEAETNPEKIKELKEQANSAFQKAAELSPKRQEVYLEWIKTDLLTKDYQRAKEKSQKCIDLNPKLWECQWLMDLTDIYFGKSKEIEEKYSKLYTYERMNRDQLLQLAKVYGDVKYYQPLVGIYQNIISRYEPNNPQYYASLAFVYKELGQYENARKEALKILEFEPLAKGEVEKFLRELQ